MILLLFIISAFHGIHFGMLRRFGIPAFTKDIRNINKYAEGNYFLKNRGSIPDSELKEFYNSLSNLSRKNGRFSLIYSLIISLFISAYSFYLRQDKDFTFYIFSGGLILSFFYAYYAATFTEVITFRVRAKLKEILYKRGIKRSHRTVPYIYFHFVSFFLLTLGVIITVLFVHSSGHSLLAIIAFTLSTFFLLELFNFAIFWGIKGFFHSFGKAARQLASGGKGNIFIDYRLREVNEFAKDYNNAAEEVYSVRKSLETTVKERTRQIEEQKADLTELNAAKDKLFTIIAHDLKNSFAALLGSSRILLDEYGAFDEKEKLTLIGEISESSIKSYHLLENLLNWANFQTGKTHMKIEKLQVREVAEDAISMHLASAQKKNISILDEIPTEALAYGDKFMLNTIIRNLINNAVKFTKNGGNAVLSFAEFEDYCEISVHDSGEGMPPEIIKEITGVHAFYSSEGTAGEKGVGLGLRMCKEFTEKMNGLFFIESAAGLGSKFTVRLPKR